MKLEVYSEKREKEEEPVMLSLEKLYTHSGERVSLYIKDSYGEEQDLLLYINEQGINKIYLFEETIEIGFKVDSGGRIVEKEDDSDYMTCPLLMAISLGMGLFNGS